MSTDNRGLVVAGQLFVRETRRPLILSSNIHSTIQKHTQIYAGHHGTVQEKKNKKKHKTQKYKTKQHNSPDRKIREIQYEMDLKLTC